MSRKTGMKLTTCFLENGKNVSKSRHGKEIFSRDRVIFLPSVSCHTVIFPHSIDTVVLFRHTVIFFVSRAISIFSQYLAKRTFLCLLGATRSLFENLKKFVENSPKSYLINIPFLKDRRISKLKTKTQITHQKAIVISNHDKREIHETK